MGGEEVWTHKRVVSDVKTIIRGHFQEVGLPNMQASDLPPQGRTLPNMRPATRKGAAVYHLETAREVED